MPNKKLIFMVLTNYIPILFACLLFRFSVILLILLIMPIVLACCNYKIVGKKSELCFLDANLLISTIAANRGFVYLFLHNVSNDADSEIMGLGLLMLGILLVMVSFLITLLLFTRKNRK